MGETVTGAAVEAVSSTVEDVNKLKDYLETSFLPGVISLGVNILISLVIYFIGSRLIKIVCKLVKKALTRASVETGVIQFLTSAVKGLLYVVLILIVIERFGIAASSILAILASAGVAVGLALQGSLSNLAGGVLILVLKPFQVGDYIVEDGGKEGTVEQIQMFYTRLVTVDNRVISIPNGTLANERIVNVSKQENRRLDLSVGIGYEADIKKAKTVLAEIVAKDGSGIPEKEVEIFVQDLADSAVVMGCRVWVKKEDYWTARARLLETIKERFDAEGISIPYNQMDVYVHSEK